MRASTLPFIPDLHHGSGVEASAEPPTTSNRPRLLDLFCGGGGTSAGYHAAGFDVTGVDIEPQPHYPYPFIHADALTVDLTGYDVIHASPPCQAYSHATPNSRRDQHPDLLEAVRQRLQAALATGSTWAYVIENVLGAPLHQPVTICGDTLRLGVRRHRLFESNLPLRGTACHHDRSTPPVPVYGDYAQRGRRKPVDVDGETSPSTSHARRAMGIDWLPWPALTQAIPPAYTHWLGVQLLCHQPPHLCPEPGPVTPPAPPRRCHCGKPLPPRPATGRWPRHCCKACRQAAYRARRTGHQR